MRTTPRCTLAVTHAEQSLSRFNHSHLTSAHLILGLMMLRNGIPFNVLTRFGLSIESVEAYLSSLRVPSEETTKRDNTPCDCSRESQRTSFAC
jgi:ATP-dependent Clp protease ATP-binding subunit ClpA